LAPIEFLISWSGGADSVIFLYIPKKAANSSATSLSLTEKS
jgi:PP-loop superfamily ATP-utilizing enzyme